MTQYAQYPAVTISSIPLPVGAATAAKQDTGNASLASIDGKTPTVGQKTMAASSPVVIASDQSAVPVSAASLPLPTGASTSALQTTGNTSLASIDSKTPSFGQAIMTLSSPVVIASDQSTIPVSASTLPLPAGAATSALQTTGNTSLSSIDGKTPTVGQKTMAASSPVVIASDQTAVAISAASLPLPTGAATETTLAAASAKLPATLGQKTMTASLAVVVASDQTAVPISAASLPLPTGAATETTLAAASAKLPATLGQKAMTASLAVVIASDQSAVPVSGTVTANAGTGTFAVSAVSLPLPSGASTSAKQPALGTAGSASADVITVQGIASMTALKVDGSAVTQPVSGTVSAAQSGTWTVQPGNTANTTAWLVDQTTATATFQDGNIAGTSLTGSFATVITTGGILKNVTLRNSCDKAVVVSLDGGSTTAYILDSGDYISVDLKSLGLKIATSVALQAKHNGSTPTSGSIRINGVY